MTSTPIYGLTEWSAAQASPWVPENAAKRVLEAIGRGSVADRDLTAPPGSCVDGACYLVKATGTGAWSSHDGQMPIAVGTNAANGWLFATVATEGQFLWIEDEAIRIQYVSSAWAQVDFSVFSAAITAGEAISAGQFVNIYASSGAKARKANATDNTKPVDGYALASISNGASGSVMCPGQVIGGLTGLTAGSDYYLDTTGGAITTTAPSTAGNLAQ